MEEVPWIIPVILQIVLIGLNALFACAEIAVLSVKRTRLEQLVEEGSKNAILLKKLTQVPAKYLATIQVAITLAGFMGSAFAADSFSERFVRALSRAGIHMHESVAIILITVILAYFSLVFGELVPKRLAMKNPEKISLKMARILTAVSVIFAPVVWLLTASTNGILRLLGIDPNAEREQVTEEEIRMLVDAGNEEGTIDEDEKEMIQNIFEFDDITVDEICTRRQDAVILYQEDSIEEWEAAIHESRHSFFPFCGESADDVLGVLDAKDFFRLDSSSKEEIIANAVRPAYFVPGTIKADVLFANMRKSSNYFAIVLDEYGGMDGIITVRDLIEEVVGDLVERDEEIRPKEIVQISARTWRIQGSAQLDDVARQLKVTLPLDDYDTFGGFIFGELGEIPQDGSRFELDTDDLHIRVYEVRDHRIEGTIVRVLEKEQEQEDSGE
ncbi:MAG: HlyC/CorC family transporter [Eubacterium sp.]|nr:HlyC/CorC family transporter [Eubacterium sp.]